MDFGTNFHSQLNGHPIQFSFVLANLGTNLTLQRQRAPHRDAPGSDPRRARGAGEPAADRVPDVRASTFRRSSGSGLAYDLMTSDNNRLTLLGDFNQPNNNRAGFSGGAEWASHKLGGSDFGFALRGSYSYLGSNNSAPPIRTAHRPERRRESARVSRSAAA